MKKILSIVAALGLALGLATSAQAQYGYQGHGGPTYRGPSFGGPSCNYQGGYQQPVCNYPGHAPSYPQPVPQPVQQPMPQQGFAGYPNQGLGGINVNPNIDINITINTILGNNNVINTVQR